VGLSAYLLLLSIFLFIFAVDMFKKLSIICVFAAVLSVVMHSFIPHHEHGEVICFEQTHDADDEKGDAQTCCLDEQQAIFAQNKDDSSVDCPNICCDFHFPPVLLFTGDFFALSSPPAKVINKPSCLNLYASADIHSAHALRAPPQI
jgi:hypothetical protein